MPGLMPGLMQGRVLVRQQGGFTLIELIMVIVVLGILSFGTTQFIVNSSQSYMDTALRERQGSAARMAVEKMSRELRSALPHSARVVDLDGTPPPAGTPGDCIEFVPVLSGSIYTSLLAGGSAAQFSSVPFISGNAPSLGSPLGSASRVAVYPINTAAIYNLSASSPVSSTVDPASVLVDTVEPIEPVAVLLDQNHQFPLDSPSRRWFMVANPVTFCFSAEERLFRYGDYGFLASQPVPAGGGLVESVPERSLLAVGARGGFMVVPATLQRNALVQLRLDIRERGEGVAISHEVQLRNVP